MSWHLHETRESLGRDLGASHRPGLRRAGLAIEAQRDPLARVAVRRHAAQARGSAGQHASAAAAAAWLVGTITTASSSVGGSIIRRVQRCLQRSLLLLGRDGRILALAARGDDADGGGGEHHWCLVRALAVHPHPDRGLLPLVHGAQTPVLLQGRVADLHSDALRDLAHVEQRRLDGLGRLLRGHRRHREPHRRPTPPSWRQLINHPRRPERPRKPN
jgi:hypothetical protein